MIACLGETTGENALWNILDTMQASEEGRRILSDKPRINTMTVDLNRLESLPSDSFGAAYVKFLTDNVSFNQFVLSLRRCLGLARCVTDKEFYSMYVCFNIYMYT